MDHAPYPAPPHPPPSPPMPLHGLLIALPVSLLLWALLLLAIFG